MSTTRQKSARLNPAAKKKLERLQSQFPGRSQTDLLDHAIDLLEREALAQQVEADLAYLARTRNLLGLPVRCLSAVRTDYSYKRTVQCPYCPSILGWSLDGQNCRSTYFRLLFLRL